jgi:hypothetical protein
MAAVHRFATTGRFRSFEEMRRFIDETYSDDGDDIPSPFMLEIGLSEHEPMFIAAIHSEHPIPLSELLAGASYSAQWLHRLEGEEIENSAICVFEPNLVEHPQDGALDYCGGFEYKP